MAVANYLVRPIKYSAVVWDGTNVTDVNTVCQLSHWSFTADNGGTAHTPFGNSFTVATGMWAVAGDGTVQFLGDTDFQNQFIAGSSWIVSA